MFLILLAMVFGMTLVYVVRCLALARRAYKEFPELAASVRQIREEPVMLRVLLAAGLFGFAVMLAMVLSSARPS